MKYFTISKLSENMRETPEGFLICLGVPIGRTGKMTYGEGETPLDTDDDGEVSVDRKAEDLFHPDTMASFEGKPFTIGHPSKFVTPSNWSALAKGVLHNVRQGDSKDENGEQSLLADIHVTDATAIGLIKSGVREVSSGYEAIYKQLGEGKGRQKQIIGNHVALVNQGRAGPSYAIRDHIKGRSIMNWSDKMRLKFSKFMDEAEKESKDADKEDKSGEKIVGDASGFDEVMKAVKDLAGKIDAMKPKDAAAPAAKKDEPAAETNTASDDDVNAGLEDRIKAIEMAVQKLMENQTNESEAGDADEESEEMGDEDPSDTGDTASRAEILAPGIQMSKDVKAKAIKIAYGTKDGKAVIEQLTGGKAPTFDSKEKVGNLFIAASEILKAKRGTGLGSSRNSNSFETGDTKHEHMTAEKMNERNQAFWSRK